MYKRQIPKSPADISGIIPGDIIKKINGDEVTEIKSVQKIIGSLKPGQNIDMEIQRGSELVNVNILVSKMEYFQ